MNDVNDQKTYYAKEHAYLAISDRTYTDNIVKHMIRFGRIERSDKILEIGAGQGRFTYHLLKRGFRVSCLDISADMLKKLRERLKNANLKKLYEADITAKNHGIRDVFSIICGVHILHHLKDIDRAVDNIAILLKRSGRIVFVEPNPLNPLFYLHILSTKDISWKYERNIVKMRKTKLKNLLLSHGFKNIKVTTFGFFPPLIVNTKLGYRAEKWLCGLINNTPINLLTLITAEKR